MRQIASPCFAGAGASAKQESASPRHTVTEEPVETSPEFTTTKGGALDDITRP